MFYKSSELCFCSEIFQNKIKVLGCALEGLLVIALIVASRFINLNWVMLYVRYTASSYYWCCSLLFDFPAFQQLDIDYGIGERHNEFLPNSAGPAAIIRIFGVTREGYMFLCSYDYSSSCGLCWRVILSYYVLRSQCVLSGAWVWTIFLHQLPARNGPWWYFRLQTNIRGFYSYPILCWPFCSMKVLWKYILSLYHSSQWLTGEDEGIK